VSKSEVHIFWWNCDGYDDSGRCTSSAQVMGEGLPPGWWRVAPTMISRHSAGHLTFDEKSMAFCSERCATAIRDALFKPNHGAPDDEAQDASVLLDALTQRG
jgi:hypothetical protein